MDPSETKPRLLIVEDEEGLAHYMRKRFTQLGFEADYALDGFAALDMVNACSYDLMFLDQRMPGMSGLEVLARLRSECSRLPVILLSAYSSEELAVRALQMGAMDYIEKRSDPHFIDDLHAKAIQAMKRCAEESKTCQQTEMLRRQCAELGCLYALEKLFDVPEASPRNALEAAANIINPSGAGDTCVVIRIGKERYTSKAVFASDQSYAYEIYAAGKSIGTLTIFFAPDSRHANPAPGSSGQLHDLNRAAADRIGHFMDFWRTTQRLRESNAELEEYAHVASHDLQAPLQKIASYAELLMEDYGDQLDDTGRQHLDVLITSAQSMRTLVRDTLALARLDSDGLRLKPVELDHILLLVKNQLSAFLQEHKARVTVDALPCVMGDETRLTQLFLNLLVNGVKFNESAQPDIRIGIQAATKSWWIYVRDNGIGIAPSDQERIFLPFKRLHNGQAREGTGIGLALCRKIMRQHEGLIEVESRPGQGSTFWLEFPKDLEAERAAGETKQTIPDE